ncbi:MAG: hypothetical protein M3Q07_24450 [Pseudobdellovibrionaceae bacterium]|nr:hypothetical protein [Pseudobdellovibrionaceae bacterium]
MKDITFTRHLVPFLFAIVLLGACGQRSETASTTKSPDQSPSNELAGETERLLIADGQNPIVRIFDVAEGAVISNFPVAGPASVYTGASGRFAYAVQSSANKVDIIDGSMIFEDHGDHQHYDKFDPILVDNPLSGNNPIHFVAHDQYVAAFFDNDGEALILDENSLLSIERSQIRIKTAMPHHGAAVPFGDSILVTRPELLPGATKGTPTGIEVYKTNGEATGQVFGDCFSVHGEASLQNVVAFGCDDGVLLVKSSADELSALKLKNPMIDAEKRRVGTLISNENVSFFVANFGAGKYAKIDPESQSFEVFDAPLDYAQFIFTKDGGSLLFLGKDGQLAVVDALSGELKHKSPVTAAATGVDYGARDAKIAAGKNYVYLTNPATSELIVFSLSAMKEVGRFKVAGEPTKLTVLDFPS